MPGLWDDTTAAMGLNPMTMPAGIMGAALAHILGYPDPNNPQQPSYPPGQSPTDIMAGYMADPSYRSDEDIQRTAQNPPAWHQSLGDLASLVMPGLVGSGPVGALTAGAKGTGTGAASAAATLADQLRQLHWARNDPLPLLGATHPIVPPPHIQTMDDFNALVQRNADQAMLGKDFRDWYPSSGGSVYYHMGEDKPLSTAFAGGAAATSPGTDVASNATHAITLHNQAMAGDPLSAGRFPDKMGAQVASYYYGGATPVGGVKTQPFYNAIGSGVWMSPEEIAATANPHTFVNDIWNMRRAEYPGAQGRIWNQPGGEGPLYEGKPTLGEGNFTRVLNTATREELAQRTNFDWLTQQEQAAGWSGIKSLIEGTPVEQAGQDFSHGLQNNYGQLSWESAPGATASNHFPEYASASPEDRQAFHDAIRSVLTDDQGRDIIARHLGLLTGRTFDAPGYFEGASNPGSQSQVALGQAPGGFAKGVDPASTTLANTSELVRGLLLRQDAVAWHKPTYMGLDKPKLGNLADVDIGRTLTPDETVAVAQAMHDATGTDFHSPIGTSTGFRFLNVPEVSNVSNVDFQKAVSDAVGGLNWPGEARITKAHADSGYFANDWTRNPGGEDYLRELGGAGSPDLQRAAKELLATLGPKVAEVEEHFARTRNWTPDRSTRVWETNPDLQQYQGATVPAPRRPWLNPPPDWQARQQPGLLTPPD